MTVFYAIADGAPLPERLHFSDTDTSIRPLSPQERLAIEDQFFSLGTKIKLNPGGTAVIVSQSLFEPKSINEYALLVEFALALLSVSGFQPIEVVAALKAESCTEALQRPLRGRASGKPKFSRVLSGSSTNAWLKHLFAARERTVDRMHITADRFLRFLRTENTADSLLDLCISLESLLDAQTEVKFRFGTSLTKITGRKGSEAEQTAKLLEALYDLRSKLAHGDPGATKLQEKMESERQELHKVARITLTKYVLFMSEHSRQEWKDHIRTLIFA